MKKVYQELTFVKRYLGCFGETRSQELPVSTPEEAHKKAKRARKRDACIGYVVYQREYVKVDGRRFYDPEVKQIKNVVFGQVLTRQQVEEMPGVGKYLILQEMKDRKNDKVVRLCTGRFVSPDEYKNETIVDC